MLAAYSLASILFLTLATGYLAATTPVKFVLYFITMLLFGVYMLARIFKILHLPGADELLLSGLSGMLCGAGLVLKGGLKNETGKVRLHQLLLGIVIFLQIASANLFMQELTFARIANYLIVALAATPLIRQEYIHRGEKNLLLVFLINAIVVVAGEFVMLFD